MKPIIAIPVTLALVYRARSRNSLTTPGLFAAVLTAVAHALHPWSVFFALLAAFFLAGSAVTKVKHDVKARLTRSSHGAPGGEGPRNHIQVLANSVVASILILLHAWSLSKGSGEGPDLCWRYGALGRPSDVLVAGIIANYAAVAADTFSSELGILSSSPPLLITAPWRSVPPGTNGGVTATGIQAGLLGASIISITATLLMPFCSTSSPSHTLVGQNAGWETQSKIKFALSVTLIGICGSLLDSLLGAVLQASVVDIRSGKIVEGDGGGKVAIHAITLTQTTEKKEDSAQESRRIEVGHDILSNNGVNLLMASMMSGLAILGTAWVWNVPLDKVFT